MQTTTKSPSEVIITPSEFSNAKLSERRQSVEPEYENPYMALTEGERLDFKRLLTAAGSLRKQFPWQLMSMYSFMGIHNPETKEIDLVSLFCGDDDQLFLHLYHGLDSYKHIQEVFYGERPKAKNGDFNEIPHFTEVEFTNRPNLEAFDQSLYKVTGSPIPGKNSDCGWIKLRTHSSRYASWYPSAQKAVELERAMRLTERLMELVNDCFIGIKIYLYLRCDQKTLPEKIPTFTLPKNTDPRDYDKWTFNFRKIPWEKTRPKPKPYKPISFDYERLRRIPQVDSNWEAATFFAHAHPTMTDDGPAFPVIAMLTCADEGGSGFMFHDFCFDGKTCPVKMLWDTFVLCVEKGGIRPKRVMVFDPRAAQTFATAGALLGFSVELREEPAFLRAQFQEIIDEVARPQVLDIEP